MMAAAPSVTSKETVLAKNHFSEELVMTYNKIQRWKETVKRHYELLKNFKVVEEWEGGYDPDDYYNDEDNVEYLITVLADSTNSLRMIKQAMDFLRELIPPAHHNLMLHLVFTYSTYAKNTKEQSIAKHLLKEIVNYDNGPKYGAKRTLREMDMDPVYNQFVQSAVSLNSSLEECVFLSS